jgi:hypothetical protein
LLPLVPFPPTLSNHRRLSFARLFYGSFFNGVLF